MPEVLRRVGRYDLLEVIGRGGAAVVYLAQQRDLGRNVALKELAPFQADDTSFAERFVAESRVAGAMNHGNVVTVHEFFEDAGVPYIAMEYLPHGSLRQYVGNLSTAQIAGVLEGVLAGLSHGEMHGVVHRDLKPENLLVGFDGRVKIADFGVARAYNKAATRQVVTVAGTTIGTPAYMSPEQALGTDLTPATDLYSLGIVAWELLTGQVPFDGGDTPVAVLYRHVHEPVPPVRSVAPEVDEGLADWLERMLAKRPEDRFQNAESAWVELEDVVLELLGPRWRREARLVLDEQPPRRERTLTPAAFDSLADAEPPPEEAAADPSPGPVPARVTETVTGLEQQEPPTTVAPKRQPGASRTTLLRAPRRHREARPGADASAPETRRRRAIVLAIVAAMAAAGAGGAVLAGGSDKSPTHSRSGQRAAAITADANRRLHAIVQDLAVTRTRALTQMNNATSPRAQAAGARALQTAYAKAADQTAPLSGKSPVARPLHTTLAQIAADYGRLAAAAKAGKRRQWDRIRGSISGDERQLQGEVAKL
jgi:tRNA A-37 threonylcarbamoyl transferase component Bud32